MGQIRGVSISNKLLRLLQEREWIKITGREESVDRPALYVTIQCFLQDFYLQYLEGLYPILERHQRMI